MSRTMHYRQGTKVSSALRRIANMRGRSRAEWRDALDASNGIYAAERDNLARAPRLRKADPRNERKALRAIPLAEFLAVSPELDAPHAISLPERDRILPAAVPMSASVFDRMLQAALEG